MSGEFYQGDIVKIDSYRQEFLVLSKNAFIHAAGVFHVCPFLKDCEEGPLHIWARGENGTEGTAILEQIKLIDPSVRRIRKTDHLSYRDIMEISDAVQGVFEYD